MVTIRLRLHPVLISAPSLPQVSVHPDVQGCDQSLGALLDAYRTDMFPTLAPRTREQYERVFSVLRAEMGQLPVTALTPAYLRQWREQLSQRYAPGNVRRWMDTLSGPLTFAVRYLEWLPKNPLRQVRKPPEPPSRGRMLSPEECAWLLDACQRSRNSYLYPFVLLSLATGARKEEARRLRWAEVDLGQGHVTFLETKNHTPRTVPVFGQALDILRALATARRPPGVWVFPSRAEHRPMDFSTAWNHARRRAGLPTVRVHDLRHTTASYLAMSGASALEIAEVLGHKTLRMVQKYTHLPAPHMRGVLQRMVTQRLDAQEGVKHDPR